MLDKHIYDKYNFLLKSELKPALGCTEPIAIAFAAAKAREVLGDFPDSITVECSGNIIKNVKGVIVPTTGDLRGVETSAILGVVGGDASKELQVLSAIEHEHVEKTRELLETDICTVALKKDVPGLYINVILGKNDKEAGVEIVDTHLNIVKITKDDEVVFIKSYKDKDNATLTHKDFNVDNIYEFANTVKLDEVEDVIQKQIDLNTKIAEEGMAKSYGANVGKVLKNQSDDIRTVAKAYTAAGSDARMAGCTMPVIINAGSGNQGMAVSIPVIKYAEHIGVSHEKLIRALVFSNLLALYQKSGIGKLSAYCGAVSAACGAGAAITYLYGLPLDTIKMTIKNILGNVSGIVCDGAKSSCAAKVASSVDAAIMGHEMAMNHQVFSSGEGLNLEDVDKTIENVSKLAKIGMKETDVEILELMIENKE